MRRWPLQIRSFATNVRGNIAVLTAVSLPVLVGFTGLGVESGYWYYEQRRLQSAADLAAYAGAVAARAGGERGEIVDSATSEASYHGFGPDDAELAVNWPPMAGENVNARSVEVFIQQDYTRIFFSGLDDAPVRIGVRAVASFEEAHPACVIALDETAREALLASGNADAAFIGCALMSNSLADDAFSARGSASVTASCVSSAGGVSSNDGVTLADCPSTRERMPRAADPFADLPAPTKDTACTSVPAGRGAKTLSPGTYCGGLDLSGDVTLESGTYVVAGGTLRINANSRVRGEGVTFYVTDGADVRMNGNADVTLSAPTSGPYEEVLFYADPASTGTTVLFNGTAESRFDGALYFPTQAVEMRGNFGGSGACTRFVAKTIEFGGNASLRSDCSGAGLSKVTIPGYVNLVE